MTFVAFPGGKIFLDNKAVGTDVSTTLTLKPGEYTVKVVNKFLGEHKERIYISSGQTGPITINW